MHKHCLGSWQYGVAAQKCDCLGSRASRASWNADTSFHDIVSLRQKTPSVSTKAIALQGKESPFRGRMTLCLSTGYRCDPHLQHRLEAELAAAGQTGDVERSMVKCFHMPEVSDVDCYPRFVFDFEIASCVACEGEPICARGEWARDPQQVTSGPVVVQKQSYRLRPRS